LTAIVLQARLDSSRLPGKELLPLGKRPMVLRIMEALKNIPVGLYILACPEDSSEAFGPLAKEVGFTLFTGPKEDVLGRFCLCLRKFNIKHVIRATGDNPFVFADAARDINKEALDLQADYACYQGLPFGAGVESVSAAALFRAEEQTSAPYDREHVCPYLYAHPEKFLLHRPFAPKGWQAPEIRLTVDTQEDYERAKVLYNALEGAENRYQGETIINAYANCHCRPKQFSV